MIFFPFQFLFSPRGSSPGCASSRYMHTQLPTSPRLQPPTAESPCTPLPSQLNWRSGFQEENLIPHRKACLAYRLFWQVETPFSLVTKWWVLKSWKEIMRFCYRGRTVDALKTRRCWWKHLAVRLETYQSMIKMTCSLAWCLSWLHCKLL